MSERYRFWLVGKNQFIDVCLKLLRYVSEVVIGAPLTIDDQMINHFKIDYGTLFYLFLRLNLISSCSRFNRATSKWKRTKPIRICKEIGKVEGYWQWQWHEYGYYHQTGSQKQVWEVYFCTVLIFDLDKFTLIETRGKKNGRLTSSKRTSNGGRT